MAYPGAVQAPTDAQLATAVDETAPLNAALAAGGVVRLENRTYYVSVDRYGTALRVTQPGTSVVMGPLTRIVLFPNGLPGYQTLLIDAANVTVTGGTLVGDVDRHTGTTGEWGMGVRLTGHASNAVVRGVTAARFWGDGFYVGGGPANVSMLDDVAIDNRRQGMSVTWATGVRISGGAYVGTGRVRMTAPAAGIDVEPNSASAPVTGVHLENIRVDNNVGWGLVLAGGAGAVDATVRNVVASRNGVGLGLGGAVTAEVSHANVTRNTTGVLVTADVPSDEFVGVSALLNTAANWSVWNGARTERVRCPS